jgi:hypothetical protein
MEPPDAGEDDFEIRPLPQPPRCRGISLGKGRYSGCAYGYRDWAPFSGPRDCPVCNSSGIEGPVETTLPHSSFGDEDCCGCLTGIVRGEVVEIACNECGAVIRTVPVTELQNALDEMELTLDVCSEMCPYCRSVNVLPGFSRMLAFTCRNCGKAVSAT